MSCCGNARQWDEWLCEIGRMGIRVPADGINSAFRNVVWNWRIGIVGDFSSNQVIGRVAAMPNGAPLVVMTTLGPVFDDGVSYCEFSLTANQTRDLPGDIGGTGVSYFPFMLTLVPPDAPARPLLGGLLPVLGAI